MSTKVVPFQRAGSSHVAGEVHIGRIVEIRDGRPFVEFAGHRASARVALSHHDRIRNTPYESRSVLLALEDGDPDMPVIIGWVDDRLPSAEVDSVSDRIDVDGERISFEGREEIVLRCGEASITLRADGQLILKGTRVISRASETNKIRGATVQIN